MNSFVRRALPIEGKQPIEKMAPRANQRAGNGLESSVQQRPEARRESKVGRQAA